MESLVEIFSVKVSVFLSKRQNPIIFRVVSETKNIFDQNEKIILLLNNNNNKKLLLTNTNGKMSMYYKSHIKTF